MAKNVKCPMCHGIQNDTGSLENVCPLCNGRGTTSQKKRMQYIRDHKKPVKV